MLPAEKRLQADDLSGGHIHLRLINEEEFISVERQAQTVLQRQPVSDLGVHFFGEEPKVVASLFFGAVHGGISMLDQAFSTFTVVWKNADAEAAADIERVSLHDKFLDHCSHEPFGGDGGVSHISDTSEYDEEFVSAEAGDCVLITRPSFESFCNLLQKKVAERVPERVVDVFEAIEIEEQKRNLVFLTASASQGLG